MGEVVVTTIAATVDTTVAITTATTMVSTTESTMVAIMVSTVDSTTHNHQTDANVTTISHFKTSMVTLMVPVGELMKLVADGVTLLAMAALMQDNLRGFLTTLGHTKHVQHRVRDRNQYRRNLIRHIRKQSEIKNLHKYHKIFFQYLSCLVCFFGHSNAFIHFFPNLISVLKLNKYCKAEHWKFGMAC